MQPMHDDCFEEILCSIDVTADPYDDVTFMGQIKTQVSHRLNVIQQSKRDQYLLSALKLYLPPIRWLISIA